MARPIEPAMTVRDVAKFLNVGNITEESKGPASNLFRQLPILTSAWFGRQ